MILKFEGKHVVISKSIRKIVEELINDNNYSDEIIEYEEPSPKSSFKKYKR